MSFSYRVLVSRLVTSAHFVVNIKGAFRKMSALLWTAQPVLVFSSYATR